MREYSDIHVDSLTPLASRGLGEYRNYPERHAPEEKSVLERMGQFGINPEDVQERFGKTFTQLNGREYGELMKEFLPQYLSLVVASVFDRYLLEWNKDDSQKPSLEERFRKMLFTARTQRAWAAGSLGMHFIHTKQDMHEAGERTKLLMCMEGGGHLITKVKQFEQMVANGVSIFGLMYNDTNPLADKENGLTDLGRKGVEYLLDQGRMIDLAHSSVATRRDIVRMAENAGKGNLILYTHGTLDKDLDEEWAKKLSQRAITEQEVKGIVKAGGLVGLGVTWPFYNSVSHVAAGIDRVAQMEDGLSHVAIGGDWGGVPPVFTRGISGAHEMHMLADELSEQFGYSDEQVDSVMRDNAIRYFEQNLPASPEANAPGT